VNSLPLIAPSSARRVAALRTVSFAAGLFLIPLVAVAQPPNIQTVTPRGLTPGQATQVTLRGERLTGAKAVWTSFPADVALAMIDKNGTEPGQVVFQITPKPEATPGIHGIRVLTPQGVSSLFGVMIDTLPIVAEAGAHNTAATAQEIPIPCVVEGNADSLSRDYFKVQAKKGQTLSIEVFARRLGSPLDASLFIERADGKQLIYSDDAPGLSSDPQLAFTAPEDGTYLIEVRDIRFQGGGLHTYRLRVGDFPLLTGAIPSAVQRGQAATLSPAGPMVTDIGAVSIPADESNWKSIGFKRADGASSGFAWLHVTSVPVAIEQEPNDAIPEAKPIPGIPCELHGRIEKPGDVDRFLFDVKAQTRLLIRGSTRVEGWPTDLQMRLLNKDAGQIALADDQGTDEGLINFTFPADGQYTLEVTDLLGRGGPQYGYRIEVAPYQASFEVAASTESINLPAGGVVPITVTTTRLDYGGAIDLSAENLPQGVTASPTRIGPGVASAVLTLQAAKDAPQANLAMVQIVGKARIGETDVVKTASLDAGIRGRWSNVRSVPPFVERDAALTVTPATKLSVRVEPAEVVFGKELKAKVKVIAERGEGIDEQIVLATEPAQNALPGNVAIAMKPIEKGQTEVELELTANENAPLGPFTLVLAATHKKGNDTTSTWTPGLGLRLEAPFQVTVNGDPKKLTKGGELPVKVQIQRNPAYQGEIKLTVDKLPKGVTVAEVVVPADKNEADLVFKAAADAMPGAANEVVIQSVSPANGKIKGSTPVPGLTVE
jgi:hypothetical protein